MVALLSPVAKAYLTDRALDCCIMGQQVFGGHGFIREWGQEQLVRDTRITQIYEGTNGIQSLDLMGRKIAANGGQFYEIFAGEVAEFIEAESGNAEIAPFIVSLSAALERLSDTTEYVLDTFKADSNAIVAASVEYLELFGLTAYAYFLAKMANVAAPKGGDEFYAAKVNTAKFFFNRLLPKTVSLAESIRSGSEDMMSLTADQF